MNCYFQAMLVGQILWVTAVSLIRASVLCLYIHIFRTNSFCLACYTVHVFNFLYFGSTIMAACLICRPLAANWDAGIGHCGNQKSLDLYIGVFNLLMDICVVILPMPVLWHLQMSQSKKVVLSGMFGMGIVYVLPRTRQSMTRFLTATRCSICAVTLARIRVTSLIHDGNEQKIYALITLFACLEAQLSVINTCLPVMRPVFTKLNSKIWFWTSGLSKINLHRLNTISGRGQYSQRSSRKGDSHNQRLHSRPSTASCSITSRRGDDRAVIMMDSNDASHISTNLVSSRPQLPPESKDCSSETRSEVLKTAQVIVNPDWDIEKVRGGE